MAAVTLLLSPPVEKVKMRYVVEETQTRIQSHSGNQEVEIPDGCWPLIAARGIGVWQVLYLRPIGDVPAPIEVEPVAAVPIEQIAPEPEVYVSKKDKAKKVKKQYSLCSDCGSDPCTCGEAA